MFWYIRTLVFILPLVALADAAQAACFFRVTNPNVGAREIKLTKFYTFEKGAQYSCREIRNHGFDCDHTGRPMGPESMPSNLVQEPAKGEFSLDGERCSERRQTPSSDLQCSVKSGLRVANEADFKHQFSTDFFGTTLNKHVLMIEQDSSANGFLLTTFKASEKLAPDVSSTVKKIGFDILPGGSNKTVVSYPGVDFTISCERRDARSSTSGYSSGSVRKQIGR